ncbi:hypothetical protein U1Q18_046178, partial [Sarracenia purpurea var. burkii]
RRRLRVATEDEGEKHHEREAMQNSTASSDNFSEGDRSTARDLDRVKAVTVVEYGIDGRR